MDNEHPLYIKVLGEKCDQYVELEHFQAKFTPMDWALSDLFETVQDCCRYKFSYDKAGCLARSPREMKLMFSVNVLNLLEPAFCQDSDIMANALGKALQIGLDNDMIANVTAIGGVTNWRNLDTGNPECGGTLAGKNFLGGTSGLTVVEDASGTVTPIQVEVRKKCYDSKTTEDMAELTDYVTNKLQVYLNGGQYTKEIQSWADQRVPQVGQLLYSEVLANSFVVTDVEFQASFVKPDSPWYPDVSNRSSVHSIS